MFNGYHEPPGTAYNDLEVDRGKKKWPSGNGTNIQSTHMHPQNHQPEIWCSKSPYIGLPNSVNTVPKCNCPSCYQLPENQSYQGDITWHRSWLSRTYPAPVSQDLVKLQANHHWENACLPAEAYGENTGAHYVQEGGDKQLFYKSYPDLRHAELYQPAVISTLKTSKIARKEDFPKPDENELGHQTRFSSSIPNPGCGSFRNAVERRRTEEESGYSNQNEKYLNMESSRQQRTPGPYHLHPNRRAMLESFSKTVPSNANQNRVPSVGHHNLKDNVFHSYIDQNNIGKISSYNANQVVTKDKHCSRSLYQPDVTKELNPGQENLRTGLLNTFSAPPVDYHGISFNRDFQNTLDRDFQKYMNGRNPQYLPRNNICDVIFRNCQNFVVDTRKDYNANRKGVINTTLGSPRAAQPPPKYMDVGLSKSPTYGKLNSRDCGVSGRVSSDLKLVVNPNGRESFEGYQKADDIIHSHFTRTHVEGSDSFAAEKVFNPFPPQNPVFKGPRRPEHSYRDIQLPYDQANGMMHLKNNTSIGINQEQIPNMADIHTSLEAYNRVNNNLTYDGSCQQFEKLHDQTTGENKVQPSVFLGHQTEPNFFEEPKKFRQPEKEDQGKISHLESIRYEELCKNGTSKISPLRLLRKKKFTQPKKEDSIDTPTQDAGANSKNATSPLDVRRFWATWAEEEDDNVPQTQMVVLDCHNIDPAQAGLLHLYNPEPVRTIHLDETNLLDVKSSQYDSQCEQNLAYKTITFDNNNGEKVSDGTKTDAEDEKFKDEARKLLEETKYLDGSDLSYGMTLIMDSAKEAAVNSPDKKLNTIVSERTESNNKIQTCEDNVKQFDIFKYCEKDSERVLDENHTSIKNRLADHVMSCDNSEISSVLIRDDLEAEVPNVKNVKEIITDDFQSESQIRGEETDPKNKELSASSDSSDDSQTGDISTISNLPTSEYRKNKFLDYTGDSFCNGSFSLKSTSQALSKEVIDIKNVEDTNDVEEKLENLTSIPKSSEIGQNDLEIDEILKKLSDINVQSPEITGKGVESMSDMSQKLKTDKRIIDRKEKKPKKLSHKSSRTDQLTLQNISINKPKIKFSIQKSHDLKISLRVLSNEIKCDDHISNEGDGGYKGTTERGYSSEGTEDNETMEKVKNSKGDLIPLKMKSSSEENEKSKEDEDETRKCRKFLKKKKIRLDRSPSPKTPVLKIKKNRYLLNGTEKEGNDDASSSSDLPTIVGSESQNHGDFQVHETVDSAKIKLTFKRNKNNNGKKSSSSEVEAVDMKNEAICSEYSLVTDSNLGGPASLNDNSNDVETTVSSAEDQNNFLKQDEKDEGSVMEHNVNDIEPLNPSKTYSNDKEFVDESSNLENESLVLIADSSEIPSHHYERVLAKSEKKDPQLSLPVVNVFGCEGVEHSENQKDYLLNNLTSEIAEKNGLDNQELPDCQDVEIDISGKEGMGCDKVAKVVGKESNIVENYPSKELEEEKETVNENEENTSKPDASIKMELASSERDMDCDTDEKYGTDDIDMEVSFISSIEKLANSNLLKSENEVENITASKSPFISEDCLNNSFTETFENENFCSVKDTIAKEPEHADHKITPKNGRCEVDKDSGQMEVEVDTKEMWRNLDDTTAKCFEVKKEIILSQINDPLKELSEEKIADDLISIDFSGDHIVKDIDFPINIDNNNVAGIPKHEYDENVSNFGTGEENIGEIIHRHEEGKNLRKSQKELNINDARAIDDCVADRGTEDEMKAIESNQENILDIRKANEAPIQQELFIEPVGISPTLEYLPATDDNNNNNISSSNDNSNNNNDSNINDNNDINKSWNNNENHRSLQKENLFLTRSLSRRCSCEDQNRQQKQNTERLRCRSKSLNINITRLECDNKVETEGTDIVLNVPVLDIPVSEIPLPPGDAPPGNCFNLEKFRKCKFLTNEKDVNFENASEVFLPPRIVASSVKKNEVEISESDLKQKLPLLLRRQDNDDLLPQKGFKEFSISSENPIPEESSEQKFFEDFRINNQEKLDINGKSFREKEDGQKVDLGKTASNEKSSEIECKSIPEEVPGDLCGVKSANDCPEYSRNTDETICTQDADLDLGESSFRTVGLYECEGLTFDEGLTISDDMEEEKVSDDDKFRNIMQNCLDNAKKFLSEGNLKLFPCTRDDFLEIDCFEDQTQDKKQDHISKDVLLASCEKSSSDDLVLNDHQFSDISADFVPSFCSDAGSNLCPEILPVDNWPYLEEEVASSPLRNKQEDSDLLSSCIENNFRIESSPLDQWNLLSETEPEYVCQRLKNKSRAVSVCVTEGSALLKTTEKSVVQRRRTIEGIGRWKSFHSSNEELTKSEDILPIEFVDEKYRLSPNKEVISENNRSSKSRRHLCHEKQKKRSNTERFGDTVAHTEETLLEKPKPKSARNSIDFKSSLWQPKVVLFRISKKMINDLSKLPKRSLESDSSHKAQTEEDKKVKNKNDYLKKRETDDLNQSSKSNKSVRYDEELLISKTTESESHSNVDQIREILSQDVQKKPRTEKPSENSINGIKRKKSRFRNLYPKKRIVPDKFDLTKDKSATQNSSSLVDSEEPSRGRDLPKQAVFSQCKSTKSVNVTNSDELHKKAEVSAHHTKHKTGEEEDALKAKRKYKELYRQKESEVDSSRHSYRSRDNKRRREDYESEHEMESQRKKERSHTRENEKAGHGEIGGGKLDECTGDEKSRKLESTSGRDHYSKSKNKPNKHKYWKCEVCGFSKSSERVVHIQSHPFHCQSCHLAFKAETNFLDHLTRKHKDIRNQHHCLLCELSFDLEKDYYRHLETREHKHLETVEKNTINTLFTLLTGHPCPVLGQVESKPEWLPTQAGTVHFYHQATPLSLALQYLKLHRDKTATLSTQIE